MATNTHVGDPGEASEQPANLPPTVEGGPYNVQPRAILDYRSFISASVPDSTKYCTIVLLLGPFQGRFGLSYACLRFWAPSLMADYPWDWLEANEYTIPIPERNEHVFAIFYHWIHTGTIEIISRWGPGVPSDQEVNPDDLFVECWLLGNAFGNRLFQNTLTDCYLTTDNPRPPPPRSGAVKLAYDATIAGARIRKILADKLLLSLLPGFGTIVGGVNIEIGPNMDECRADYEELEQDLKDTGFLQDVCIAYHVHIEGDNTPCRGVRCWYGSDGVWY